VPNKEAVPRSEAEPAETGAGKRCRANKARRPNSTETAAANETSAKPAEASGAKPAETTAAHSAEASATHAHSAAPESAAACRRIDWDQGEAEQGRGRNANCDWAFHDAPPWEQFNAFMAPPSPIYIEADGHSIFEEKFNLPSAQGTRRRDF
jgi:hypothetical protein